MYTSQFSALSVGNGTTTTTTTSTAKTAKLSSTIDYIPEICKFLIGVCKLWVFFRESLVLFEGKSVSSYFDKLLGANTVGVPDIPLLRVLLGILVNVSAPFLRFMFLLECKILLFYAISRLLHVPIRFMKEVVRAYVLW
jgi:hypothetical protein